MRQLKFLEGLQREHVEAGTTVDECFGDGDAVDDGGTQQRKGAHNLRGFGVVVGIEGDRVVRPAEGPCGFGSRKSGTGFAR